MATPFDSLEGSKWLDDAACKDMDNKDFFVEAGHMISEDTLNVCRGCPVRKDCIKHAYRSKVTGGYYAGMSPGQRREMSLEEALVFIDSDPLVVKEKTEDETDLEDFEYR